MKKSLQKEEYVLERLPKRIFYLIKLIIFSEIVYYLFAILLFDRYFSIPDMLKSVVGINMVNGALWTVVAMLVMQTAYYICYRMGLRRYTLIATIGCGVYIVISILRSREPWEMQSCCAFILGSYIANNERKVVENYIERNIILATAVAVFIVSYITPYLFEYLLHEDYIMIRVVAGTIASFSFIIVMLFVVKRVIISNKVIVFAGTLFTEIYLWHGLIIDVVKKVYPTAFMAGKHYIIISIVILVLVVCSASGIKHIERQLALQKRKVKV